MGCGRVWWGWGRSDIHSFAFNTRHSITSHIPASRARTFTYPQYSKHARASGAPPPHMSVTVKSSQPDMWGANAHTAQYMLHPVQSVACLPARPPRLGAAAVRAVVRLCVLYPACIPSAFTATTPSARIRVSQHGALPGR